jgi:hypothetical protein
MELSAVALYSISLTCAGHGFSAAPEINDENIAAAVKNFLNIIKPFSFTYF